MLKANNKISKPYFLIFVFRISLSYEKNFCICNTHSENIIILRSCALEYFALKQASLLLGWCYTICGLCIVKITLFAFGTIENCFIPVYVKTIPQNSDNKEIKLFEQVLPCRCKVCNKARIRAYLFPTYTDLVQNLLCRFNISRFHIKYDPQNTHPHSQTQFGNIVRYTLHILKGN